MKGAFGDFAAPTCPGALHAVAQRILGERCPTRQTFYNWHALGFGLSLPTDPSSTRWSNYPDLVELPDMCFSGTNTLRVTHAHSIAAAVTSFAAQRHLEGYQLRTPRGAPTETWTPPVLGAPIVAWVDPVEFGIPPPAATSDCSATSLGGSGSPSGALVDD